MRKSILFNILFWLAVLAYFVLTVNMDFYGSYVQILESGLNMTIIQFITAIVSLKILIPRFLNKKKNLQFIVLLLVLLIAMFSLYILFKESYYDDKYFEYYNDSSKIYVQKDFFERLIDFKVFLSKSIKFLTPVAILLMFKYYRNQQQYLKISEQKKEAELNALKHQLNPHFLFNTLNNIYSLSVIKSDKTPEAIDRLSNILDYILYRCQEQYVPIENEVKMIENYLALEKIRYSKRVHLTTHFSIDKNVLIAPLILLTFIENAFKHGVSQELNKATIDISLKANETDIIFELTNSKPSTPKKSMNSKSIGLKNVTQQLDLLYEDSYELKINDEAEQYGVYLKLPVK